MVDGDKAEGEGESDELDPNDPNGKAPCFLTPDLSES